MKKILFLILVGQFLITSCNRKSTNEKLVAIPLTKDSTMKKELPIKIDTQNPQIKKDSLDISFVGKTTQELDKFNLHVCFGGIIEGDLENEKYAVSDYSLIIDNCRDGKNKITLEKFSNYYENGKANFIIKDEILVNSKYPEKCYSKIILELNNEPKNHYLIEYEDNSKEFLTNIHKIWKIDLEQMKFIKIEKPKNFKCNNPDYTD
jgi:hypothetical protein